MSEVTVKQLATTVGIPVERLVAQLNDAGISVEGPYSTLTEQEKLQLLTYLRRSPHQVTLRRKTVSELRKPVSVPGDPSDTSRPVPLSRPKTVTVEVRRKMVHEKRGDEAPATAGAGGVQLPSEHASPRPLEAPSGRVDSEARRSVTLQKLRAEQETRRLAERDDEDSRQREDARRLVEGDEKGARQREEAPVAAPDASESLAQHEAAVLTDRVGHHIFISYARKDLSRVEPIAHALESLGYRVWWDAALRAGRRFDEEIEQALGAAACVLVVWTAAAVVSRWVRAEAMEGLNAEKLVPVFLEAVQPPLYFRGIHGHPLEDWDGKKGHRGFQRLVRDIAELAGPGKFR